MGKITVTPCEADGMTIEGLYVIEPTVFKDERGYFMETYNQNDFKEAGLNMVFVQDNQSMSVKGVLRGLHYQKQFPQGKAGARRPRYGVRRGRRPSDKFQNLREVVRRGTVCGE